MSYGRTPLMTSPHVGEPLAAFLTACEVERREHRSHQRQRKLSSGRLISAEGGRFLYSFTIDPQRGLKDELSIRVEIDGALYDGTIVSLEERSITVALNVDLGREVLKARLDTGELDLLQILISHLRALQNEGIAANNDRPSHLRSWNRELADLALKIPEAATDTGASAVNNSQYGAPSDLTAEQLDILTRSISQPVTYVWGPPGTGKSLLLAAIALKLYDDNKRVLIVSQTNHAVDGVLENICRRITERGRKSISQGSILRLGTPVRGTLIERFGDQVVLERVVTLSQEKVADRLAALQKELAAARDEIFSLARRGTLLETFNQILVELERIENGDAVPDRAFISALKCGLFSEKSPGIAIPACADARGKQDLIDLMYSGLERIKLEIADCDRDALNSRSAELSSRQLELAEGVLVLERFIRDARENLLKRSRIIASTATTAMMSASSLGEFDAVLIDEGSMLPLPLAYLLSGVARERVVIAGDFRQLPAIARSNEPVVAKWYSRDIFECAGVIDQIEAGRCSPAVAVLKTQFRSGRALCDLINERFYSGFLRTMESGNLAERYIYRDPLTYLNRYPVVLIDSSDFKPWGETRDGSKFNLLHGLIVRKLALLLSAQGLSIIPEAIGVIAPYRAQVELIRSLLEEVSLDKTIAVGTVHRFQGNERDLILLDLTDGAPHNLGVFFNPRSLRDLGARLMNVALSRARRNLIVVADMSHLRCKLAPESFMWGLLDDIEKSALKLPAKEVIGEQVVQNPSIEVRSTSGILAFQSFNEQLFLSALVTDLLAAQSEVVMTCSAVGESDSLIIGGVLEQLLKRQIRLKVMVAKSGALSYEQTNFINRLKKDGVRVLLIKHSVAPTVIIDREILWLGSQSPLNSLSSAGAKMARTVSLEAARRALEVLRGYEDGLSVNSLGQLSSAAPRAV